MPLKALRNASDSQVSELDDTVDRLEKGSKLYKEGISALSNSQTQFADFLEEFCGGTDEESMMLGDALTAALVVTFCSLFLLLMWNMDSFANGTQAKEIHAPKLLTNLTICHVPHCCHCAVIISVTTRSHVVADAFLSAFYCAHLHTAESHLHDLAAHVTRYLCYCFFSAHASPNTLMC